jgi:transposase-like protein
MPERPPEIDFDFDGYHESTPQNPNAAVKAAYLRVTEDLSLDQIADQLGYHPSTLYKWTNRGWWSDLKSEVWSTVLTGDVARKALSTIQQALDEDGDSKTARWAMERLKKEMAPPKQRFAHAVEEAEGDGGAQPWETIFDALSPDEMDVLDSIVSAYVLVAKERHDDESDQDADFSNYDIVLEAARQVDRKNHSLTDLE